MSINQPYDIDQFGQTVEEVIKLIRDYGIKFRATEQCEQIIKHIEEGLQK